MKAVDDKSGRPTMVSVRLSHTELDALRAAAEKRGESVSSFLRRSSLTEAGVRRAPPQQRPWPASQTATVGAVLTYTDSGRFVCNVLPMPSAPQFGSYTAST